MPYDVVTKRPSKRKRDSVASNTDIAHSLIMKLRTIRRDRAGSRVLEVCAGTGFIIYLASPKNIRSV